MRRRSIGGAKTAKAQRRKTAVRKGRAASNAAAPCASSAAAKATTVRRLTRELNEAVQQQAATAEVLKVISRSTFDLQTVLNTLLESAARLCEADKGSILRPTGNGTSYYFAASYRHTPAYIKLATSQTFGPGRVGTAGRVLLEGKSVQIADVLADPEYKLRKIARAGGFRTVLGVPLLREGVPIGIFLLHRAAVRPFTQKQIELVETFAAQAVIAIENTRLFNETREALERQTATAEVLRVIASSPSDLQPVFEAIATRSTQLVGGHSAAVSIFVGDMIHLGAFTPVSPEADAALKALYPRRLADYPLFELARGGKVAQVSDIETDARVLSAAKAMARGRGYRGLLFVPMNSDTGPIGVITVTRKEPGTFAAQHIQLLQTFADQAVIAIQNVRLFDEVQAKTRDLEESLQQQTATAEVLQVISRAAFDLKSVLQTLVESAAHLCRADKATITRQIGGVFYRAEAFGLSNEFMDYVRNIPIKPERGSAYGRVLLEGKAVHILDVEADPEYTFPAARVGGIRTLLAVPIQREGVPIGALAVSRSEVLAFTDKQIELVSTFADQAAIAIQNVKLFDEVQAKTHDLEESLKQQTATSEVLQVISSSPGDLGPVFDKMLENATRVCGAEFGSMSLIEAGSLRNAALYNAPPAFAAARANSLRRLHPDSGIAAAIGSKQVVHIADLRTTAPYLEGFRATVELADLAGARTVVVVPMLRDNEVIGTITIYRQEVRLFDDKQIELLSNFAKQAVIAIENTRLLKELRQSLQQQTATADVLKTISRSTVDLETVLDTLVETVARLCRADQAHMFRLRDEKYHMLAACGLTEEVKDFLLTHPLAIDRGTITGRVVLERRVIHVPDVLQDPEFTYWEGQKKQGQRTMLGIPLLREDSLIGVFIVMRTHVEPFTDKEIELAASFADQAVIAIENARLFEELRDRQAELRVTFDNMGDGVVMFDAAGRLAAWNRNFEELIELPETFLAGRPNRTEYFRYLADRGEFSADLEAELSRTVDDTGLEKRYERTRPDGRIIEVRRNPVPGGGFVLIYADITERKRAEEAVRTARDAAESALRELQTAQASLVHAQKMAALGQLTAGIAHEIKNPLNFVNNFAGLSVELLDELKQAARALDALDPDRRAEIGETIGMLTGNMEKIVEHGRRADGIVRSMLQHSRGGSDDWQPTDLNALAEEALNLAYHGARAQDPNFDITLEHDLDRNLVPVDVVPQELTRVLLNLIGNGFYAANERSREGDETYRPELKVTTRGFDGSVEVRVRDNGIGIPPENREKLFQPFFTTKPTGEGTGLGLSISYEIVTLQHGGTITVDSEVGDFTEFTVRLPRNRSSVTGRLG